MSINRYLIYFSYIGKPFHGAQRQVSGVLPRANDPATVQGNLEMYLKVLNPVNDPVVSLSSRTDSGVNAICSTCHVDLERRNSFVYDPRTITLCLNKQFHTNEIPIRILKTYLVPETFHCRHQATSRTYLYRLAFIRSEEPAKDTHLQFIPLEDFHRSYYIWMPTYDCEEMEKAARHFVGLHDFRTFMGKAPFFPDKMTRRFVSRVDVIKSTPSTYSPYSIPTFPPSDIQEYQFYDIYIEATGFLYRQVRRMVATLIGVAQGKLTSNGVKLMLQVPSHRSWDDRIRTVPAWGLYLCNVDYSAADKATFKDSI